MPSIRRGSGRLALPAALCTALLLTFAGAAQAADTDVKISEFRVDGPNGAGDEFVELFNTGTAPVAIGGWRLQGCASASGNPSDRVTVTAGTTLQPGEHYLFAFTSYSGPPAADQTYATGIANGTGAGARIVNGSTVIDGVGGTLAANQCREGTGIGMTSSGGNFARERKDGAARTRTTTRPTSTLRTAQEPRRTRAVRAAAARRSPRSTTSRAAARRPRGPARP